MASPGTVCPAKVRATRFSGVPAWRSRNVSVQGQVLELLDKVRRQMNLAMLFITHDMRVAARICHRVMVMRHGQVVEEGPTGALFAAPKSEYTGRLLAAIPGRQRLEA